MKSKKWRIVLFLVLTMALGTVSIYPGMLAEGNVKLTNITMPASVTDEDGISIWVQPSSAAASFTLRIHYSGSGSPGKDDLEYRIDECTREDLTAATASPTAAPSPSPSPRPTANLVRETTPPKVQHTDRRDNSDKTPIDSRTEPSETSGKGTSGLSQGEDSSGSKTQREEKLNQGETVDNSRQTEPDTHQQQGGQDSGQQGDQDAKQQTEPDTLLQEFADTVLSDGMDFPDLHVNPVGNSISTDNNDFSQSGNRDTVWKALPQAPVPSAEGNEKYVDVEIPLPNSLGNGGYYRISLRLAAKNDAQLEMKALLLPALKIQLENGLEQKIVKGMEELSFSVNRADGSLKIGDTRYLIRDGACVLKTASLNLNDGDTLQVAYEPSWNLQLLQAIEREAQSFSFQVVELLPISLTPDKGYLFAGSQEAVQFTVGCDEKAEAVVSLPGEEIKIVRNGETLSFAWEKLQAAGQVTYYYSLLSNQQKVLTIGSGEGKDIRLIQGTVAANPVTDESHAVTGFGAAPYKDVSLLVNGQAERSAQADGAGNFTFDLSHGLTVGDTLSLTAQDSFGRTVQSEEVKVSAPETVEEISLLPGANYIFDSASNTLVARNRDVVLSGAAHRGMALEMSVDGQQGNTVAIGKDGQWSGLMTMNQDQGQFTLRYAAIDGISNPPMEKTMSYVMDTEAKIALASSVQVGETSISIQGEEGAAYTLWVNDEKRASVVMDQTGEAVLSSLAPFAIQDSVKVTAEDRVGNTAEKTVKVTNSPLKISAGESAVLSTARLVKLEITGSPNAKVDLYLLEAGQEVGPSSKKLDTLLLPEAADGKTSVISYELTYEALKNTLNGTGRPLVAAALCENTSGNDVATVDILYDPACDLVSDGFNDITRSTRSIEGRADPDATVTLKVGNQTLETRADAQGSFRFDKLPDVHGRVSLELSAMDLYGNPAPIKTKEIRYTYLSWQQYVFLFMTALAVFAVSLLTYLSAAKKLKKQKKHYTEDTVRWDGKHR